MFFQMTRISVIDTYFLLEPTSLPGSHNLTLNELRFELCIYRAICLSESEGMWKTQLVCAARTLC